MKLLGCFLFPRKHRAHVVLFSEASFHSLLYFIFNFYSFSGKVKTTFQRISRIVSKLENHKNFFSDRFKKTKNL